MMHPLSPVASRQLAIPVIGFVYSAFVGTRKSKPPARRSTRSGAAAVTVFRRDFRHRRGLHPGGHMAPIESRRRSILTHHY